MERNNRKLLRGTVVSTKMNKTIVVEVERKYLHPLYKKQVISHKKYHVHDEKQEAKVGDVVRIVETRPLSKTKTYRLQKITVKAK
ncbi:MAG: 30S ribosomal protein S17 [Mycoplasmoidaceae bacterium]|nr:30S ribosomal protein S17 [Mycoplasmoidaceae bacterium]